MSELVMARCQSIKSIDIHPSPNLRAVLVGWGGGTGEEQDTFRLYLGMNTIWYATRTSPSY